jgi:3-oxoacyl-[acyl-carrier protein] reductase
MSEFKGRVALITGGARGIGKAIVSELASQGCDVVISDVDMDGATAVAEEMKKLGVRSLAVKTDVSEADQVDSMVKQTLESLGKLDILVNNAGITRDTLLMRMSEEDWDLVLKVNLKGAFLCTQKVIRPMMNQRSGKIINMASVVGIMGNVGQANYASSKAGLIGFTKSVAREVSSKNVQVNAVAPGFIETEMTSNLSQEVKDFFLANIPAKRAGTAEDVARVVSFLASSASDYITGQVIQVDGGLLIA